MCILQRLLKIDVEWFEYDILNQLTKINLNKNIKIICEILHNYEENLNNSINLMKKNNFKIKKLDWNNYLFYKK